MALSNDLNGVLNNVAHGISPVIKLSNGLYTLVDKHSIIPDENLGTNLTGNIIYNCNTEDNVIVNFKLLGNWSTNGPSYFEYNEENNKWKEYFSST